MSGTPPRARGAANGEAGAARAAGAPKSPAQASLKLPPTSLSRPKHAGTSQGLPSGASAGTTQSAGRGLVLPPSSLSKVVPPPPPPPPPPPNPANDSSGRSSADSSASNSPLISSLGLGSIPNVPGNSPEAVNWGPPLPNSDANATPALDALISGELAALLAAGSSPPAPPAPATVSPSQLLLAPKAERMPSKVGSEVPRRSGLPPAQKAQKRQRLQLPQQQQKKRPGSAEGGADLGLPGPARTDKPAKLRKERNGDAGNRCEPAGTRSAPSAEDLPNAGRKKSRQHPAGSGSNREIALLPIAVSGAEDANSVAAQAGPPPAVGVGPIPAPAAGEPPPNLPGAVPSAVPAAGVTAPSGATLLAGSSGGPPLQRQRAPRTGLPVEAMTIPVVDQATGAKRMAPEAGTDDKQRSQPSLSYVGKRTMHEILEQVDPNERMEDDLEEILLEIADEFIESVTRFACDLAKHRRCNTVEVKDLQLHLDQNWNIRIPGFASDEIRYHRKPVIFPGYAQQAAAVRKARAADKAKVASADPPATTAASAAPLSGAASAGSGRMPTPGGLPPASAT